MSYDSAKGLAEKLAAELAPYCDRIEVAGSIRRGKPDPKDIELVVIPRFNEARGVNLLGEMVVLGQANLLENGLAWLFAGREWALDQALKRNGPKYKRLVHLNSGICCDLFIVTVESWGVQFTIRTGPGDFSKEMVTRALHLGMQVDGGQLWRVHRDGTRTVVPTLTEHDFFAALRVPFLLPPDRSGQAFRKALVA